MARPVPPAGAGAGVPPPVGGAGVGALGAASVGPAPGSGAGPGVGPACGALEPGGGPKPRLYPPPGRTALVGSPPKSEVERGAMPNRSPIVNGPPTVPRMVLTNSANFAEIGRSSGTERGEISVV